MSLEEDPVPTIVDADAGSRNDTAAVARAAFMVRPKRFQANPATAESNAFQDAARALPPGEAQHAALEEFEALVTRLRARDIEVCVFDDTREPHTPDAIFPNNWVTFHEDGTAVLYPMCAANRRAERRRDILEALERQFGFEIHRTIDLSGHETEGRFLEGTGSLVLDRGNGIAYACASPRTDPDLAREWADRMGYGLMLFDAVDEQGRAIYHTNVMMCIGEGFAVICDEVIRDGSARTEVLDRLGSTGHEPILITPEQMGAYAGNMLELWTRSGAPVLAMSARAEASLDRRQKRKLERHAELLASPIEVIEDCAGGSVRCMIAEVRLPRHRTRI